MGFGGPGPNSSDRSRTPFNRLDTLWTLWTTPSTEAEGEGKGSQLPRALARNLQRNAADSPVSAKSGVGFALLASFLVALTSLIGVVVVPVVGNRFVNKEALMRAMTAFAAGAILSSNSMVNAPEALHCLVCEQQNGMYADPRDLVYNVQYLHGVFIVLGIFVSICMEFVFADGHQAAVKKLTETVSDSESTRSPSVAVSDHFAPPAGPAGAAVTPTRRTIWTRLRRTPPIVYNVLLGDTVHNFADGVFLGYALIKDSSYGIMIMVVIMLHQFPQELSDYFLLTGPGKLSVLTAVLVNFISSCASMLGAVIPYWTSVDKRVIGCLISYGVGTYMYIACSEIVPRMVELQGRKRQVTVLVAFALGATTIGLCQLMPTADAEMDCKASA